ncbi:hypothetical protein COBT_002089 [Conglomerata obtusa]
MIKHIIFFVTVFSSSLNDIISKKQRELNYLNSINKVNPTFTNVIAKNYAHTYNHPLTNHFNSIKYRTKRNINEQNKQDINPSDSRINDLIIYEYMSLDDFSLEPFKENDYEYATRMHDFIKKFFGSLTKITKEDIVYFDTDKKEEILRLRELVILRRQLQKFLPENEELNKEIDLYTLHVGKTVEQRSIQELVYFDQLITKSLALMKNYYLDFFIFNQLLSIQSKYYVRSSKAQPKI